MKVIKIGGGCLKGETVISSIVELIAQRGRGHIFVLSALSGITDKLFDGIDMALKDEEHIPSVIHEIDPPGTFAACPDSDDRGVGLQSVKAGAGQPFSKDGALLLWYQLYQGSHTKDAGYYHKLW